MGGFGSGRRNQNGKGTTNDCRALDVRHLQRRNLLRPGLTYSLEWTSKRQGLATIIVQVETDKLTLNYRHQSTSGGWQDKEYQVKLGWTSCNYGGRRAWFICPASGCGQRVAKLFLGSSGSFACRHCNHLAYASQRETVSDRALRLTRNIRKELGWEPGFMDQNVTKPKGMHWKTYRRLRAQHDVLVMDYLDRVAKRMGILNRQLGGIQDDLSGEG